VINNTLAKRYAKALVQLGTEDGLLDRFREDLAGLNRLFTGDAGLRAVFADPAITAGQKREIMKALIAKSGCSELVGNFLLLLVDKNRVAFLSQIVSAYDRLADERSGVIRPRISSAFGLNDGQVAAIKAALEKKSAKKVIPQVNIDNSLIGGVVIQIGDTAFDSSVKTQLKRIQDLLEKG
jgi:F-type H+-transporting ATPase subunit delta